MRELTFKFWLKKKIMQFPITMEQFIFKKVVLFVNLSELLLKILYF